MKRLVIFALVLVLLIAGAFYYSNQRTKGTNSGNDTTNDQKLVPPSLDAL